MVMAAFKEPRQLDLGYEIFIALISILSVFNMFLIFIPGVNPNAIDVVFTVNAFLTLMFVYDFGIRLYEAPSRSWYFFRDYGWADLFAIIPVFRILRLFRIVKAYRLVHAYGFRNLMDFLSTNRVESALYILVFSVIVIIQSGSYLVLIAESASPAANIKTANDAMWWAYVTITTVGYGDQYPVTALGRVVGILVMTTGVAVFATFAGYVSNILLSSRGIKSGKEVLPPGDQALTPLDELKHYLEERERIDAEIKIRLEQLERVMAGEQHLCPAHSDQNA
jgi:voltage-gated potassium channel